MDAERWAGLQKAVVEALNRSDVAGVIVSHGTDTLEETAYFLDLTVQSEKPIILIGAQRNASEKDFDGPRNLYNAARICVSPDAKNKGAMIALNNYPRIFIDTAAHRTDTHRWVLAALAATYGLVRFVEAYGCGKESVGPKGLLLSAQAYISPLSFMGCLRRTLGFPSRPL